MEFLEEWFATNADEQYPKTNRMFSMPANFLIEDPLLWQSSRVYGGPVDEEDFAEKASELLDLETSAPLINAWEFKDSLLVDLKAFMEGLPTRVYAAWEESKQKKAAKKAAAKEAETQEAVAAAAKDKSRSEGQRRTEMQDGTDDSARIATIQAAKLRKILEDKEAAKAAGHAREGIRQGAAREVGLDSEAIEPPEDADMPDAPGGGAVAGPSRRPRPTANTPVETPHNRPRHRARMSSPTPPPAAAPAGFHLATAATRTSRGRERTFSPKGREVYRQER